MPCEREVVDSIPNCVLPKMVPDAIVFSIIIRIGLAPPSETSLNNEIDTIWNEQSRVINTSCDNLLPNRP